jgi:hypothetical protein
MIDLRNSLHFLTLFLFITIYTAGQTQTVSRVWDKTIGGNDLDITLEALQTSDGGFLLGAQSKSGVSGDKTATHHGDADYWLVKTDVNGTKQWDRSFGGSGEDGFRDVKQTPDGGYILAGFSRSGVSGNKTAGNLGGIDYWIVKTDASGNKQWDRTYGSTGDDILHAVVVTSDGGYLLGGYSDSPATGDKSQPGQGDKDYWIVRIDANGNKQWDKTYGGNMEDRLEDILPVDAGGFVLGGMSRSGNTGDKSQGAQGGFDQWIVKIDFNGNKLWDRTFGGAEDDYLLTLTPAAKGFIIGGTSWSDTGGDKSMDSPGEAAHWVLKIDKDGQKIWDKSYGGSGLDRMPEFISLSQKGHLIGGQSTSPASGDKTEHNHGGADIWIHHINNGGKLKWDKTLGGDGADALRSIIELGNNEYLLAGWSASGMGSSTDDKTEPSRGGIDCWILKIRVN